MNNLWITIEQKLNCTQFNQFMKSYPQSYAPVLVFNFNYLSGLCKIIHVYIYIKQQLLIYYTSLNKWNRLALS